MVVCESCSRHVRTSDDRCPHCSRPTPLLRARQAAGLALAAFVLSACYGTPATKTTTVPTCLDQCTDTGHASGDTGSSTTTSSTP